MNFYKTVCIIALIILVISLAFIGTALSSSSKDLTFPPNVSKCPENYLAQPDPLTGEFTICVNGLAKDITGCDEEAFDEDIYNMPGTGLTSGACAKKKWAKNCKVDWDGLTNNPQICHSTNI